MSKFFTLKNFILLFFLSFSVVQLSAQPRCGFTSQITNAPIINKCSDAAITLNSLPVGGGYSYRWQKQTVAGAPFSDVAGASASTLVIGELGAYRVLITRAGCTDTSGIINLIKINLHGGSISGGPSSPICAGTDGGTLTGNMVDGHEVGLVKFQWERNVGGSGWSTITGATGKDYKTPALNSTTQFRRVSLDDCGNKAYSNIITIATSPELTGGSISPLEQTINIGGTAAPINSVTAAAGGRGTISYQWTSSLFERGAYVEIPGATSANYSPGKLEQTTYFKRIATDAGCNTSAAVDRFAVVIVQGAPLNPGFFTSASLCFFPGGLPSPLEASGQTGGVPPYRIQWQSSLDNSTWTTIAGAVGQAYQPGALTQSTYFRMMVTDAAGTVKFSGSERINKFETLLTGGRIESAATVACLGSPIAPINSVESPKGYAERLGFQWQYRTASSGGWVNIPGQIRESILPFAISEKTTFRRVAMDACGANTRSSFSNEVEVDIRPALNPGSISPTAQVINKNSVPSQLSSLEAPSGGTGSYTLSWEQSPVAIGSWSVIAGASAGSYQPSALSQATYYKRVVHDNNCLATKQTYVVEVTVNNAPPLKGGGLAGSTCVFPGNRPGLIETPSNGHVSGGTPPYSFQWEHRAGMTGAFTVIAGATSETYRPQIITQTHQYRRKVTDAAGVFAYSDTITINYITTPLLPGSIAATSAQSACGSTTPGLIQSTGAMSGYGELARYQWQVSNDGVTWTSIPGEVRESYTPGGAITRETIYRRWAFDNCSGATRSAVSNEVVFKVRPKIELKGGLVDGPFITCAGTAPGPIVNVLEACGSGGNKYEWEINTGAGWTTIAGATGPSYQPGVLNANTTFRRKVTDACGQVAYSNEVLIYVYPKIEPGVISPSYQSACGATTKLTLDANCHYTDGTVSYQWESSTNGTTWSNVNGANDNSYMPTNERRWYRLKVMSTTCNAFAYTNIVFVDGGGGLGGCTPYLSPDSESFCSSSNSFLFIWLSSAACPIPADAKVEWQYLELGTPIWQSMNTGNRERVEVRYFFLPNEEALSFRVKVTDKCGKIVFSSPVRITQKLNCKQSANTNRVQVYPNPTAASNELMLRTNIAGKNKVTIKTVDGNVLNVQILSNDRGGMRIKLPHNLASGPYFLQIVNEKGEKATEKIIVAN